MNEKYHMSSAQKRLYTLEQLQESNITYNIPLAVMIEGVIDEGRLTIAFQKLCKRHEPLRTHFAVDNQQFLQIIDADVAAQLQIINNNDVNITDQVRDFIRPFNLEKAPLIRMGLSKYTDRTLLILDIHHIICDGMSANILLNELSELYNDNQLEPLEIQYKDFAEWQNDLDLSIQENYWRNEYRNVSCDTEFPTDYSRSQNQTFDGDYFLAALETDYKQRIGEINKSTGSTGFMFFLTSLMCCISRYIAQEEIVIGIPSHGRNYPDTENMVGMFVNTLAIRGEIDEEKSFHELLLHVRQKCFDSYENEDYPFEKLIEILEIQRDTSKNPLFNVMFSYEVDNELFIHMGENKAEMIPIQMNIAKFDITLTVIENKKGYTLNWEYNTALFKKSTMERLNSYFISFIDSVLDSSEQRIGNLSYLSEEEVEIITHRFNKPVIESFINTSVIQLFNEQVLKNPGKSALYYGERVIPYHQLNSCANYIGKKLRDYHIQSNDIVALITERSIEMVIGIIGILKSGGAYLPIDPNYPEERIQYLLKDSGAKHILTTQTVKKDLNFLSVREDVSCISLTEVLEKNIPVITKPDDLAYVLYTSGTTGMPKGVMIENKGLMNLIKWQSVDAGIDRSSVILQKSTYIFDASVWEIFLALLSGAALQLLSQSENEDFDTLLKVVVKNKVTHTLMIPTVFDALLDFMKDNQGVYTLDSLKKIYLGAEAVTKDLLVKYQQVTGDNLAKINNLYGPTEATVCVTRYRFADSGTVGKVLIGSPIANTRIYILNGMHLAGVGVAGEICISGLGLARGYLNQRDLTNEKFIDSPVIEKEKIYRTGDIGKWTEDGQIEYLGRIDDQVKIRGMRVELGEIQSKILEYQKLKSAYVTILEHMGNKYLCAYYIQEDVIDKNDLRQYLANILPEYMIPQYYIQVDLFPVNSNGKLNKKALPLPDFDKHQVYIMPRNDREEIVLQAFVKILGVEKIGVKDNFFEIGGDSIKAIRIVSILRDNGYETDVKTIMQYHTVEKISTQLTKTEIIEINQEEITGVVEMTPIFKYFYQSNLSKPHHFNQSFILETEQTVDESALKNSLDASVVHHDILRLTVREGRHVISPSVGSSLYEYAAYDFTQIDNSCIEENIHKIGSEAQTSFDLKQGPLVKALLFRAKGKSYLWLIIHHLVIDGVSWRILIEDLNKGYSAAMKSEAILLPAKSTSYQEWAGKLKEYAQSYQIKKDIPYWNKIVSLLEKKRLFHIEKTSDWTKKSIEFDIPQISMDVLSHKVMKAYTLEVNDILLTSVVRAVSTFFHQDTIAVNMESHGREKIVSNVYVDRTIGWFTSIYPVVIEQVGKDIRNDLRNTKETLRKIPNHGIGYGVLSTYGDAIRNVDADITYNYLGEFEEKSELNHAFSLSSLQPQNDVSENNIVGTAISITFMVENKCLKANIMYYVPVVSTRQMNEFKCNLISQLEAIADHCENRLVEEHTASDYGEMSWSDDEFLEVSERIAKQNLRLQRIFPLSVMQEGMFYYKMLAEDSTVYVVQSSYKMEEEFHLEQFKNGLTSLSKSHSVLRMNIFYRNLTEPRQVIFREKEIESNMIDLSHKCNAEEKYRDIKESDIKRGFDLEKDSLFRVTIVKFSDSDYRLVFCFHHIIMDGWCMSILLGDLLKFYHLSSNGNVIRTDSLEGSSKYEDYIDYIMSKDHEKSLVYWETLLEEYETQASIIPLGEIEDQSDEVGEIYGELTIDETKQLDKIAKSNSVTMSTVLETTWGIVLKRYTNNEDVVFSKIVSGRNVNIEDIENTLGLFINAIPVRVQMMENDTFISLLKKMQDQAVESSEHDFCSLAQIQERAGLGKDMIQSVVAYENYGSRGMAESSSVLEMEGAREQTNYPISLSAACTNKMYIKFMYDTKLYCRNEMEKIWSRLYMVLKEIIKNPYMRINKSEILDENEKNIVLRQFNNTNVTLPDHITVLDLLHHQVSLNPQNIAVSHENSPITYEQLNNMSDWISSIIKEKGAGKNEIIAIVMERSVEMVIAIYGVLKAGCAYLPISPNLPIDRIRFMLEDSKVQTLLVDDESYDLLDAIEKDTIYVSQSQLKENISEYQCDQNLIDCNDLAYIIYTSGTTGQPKGVRIKHGSLLNLCLWEKDYLGIRPNSIVLQQFSFIFDGSILEIMACTIAGGCLEIVSDEVRSNPEEFLSRLPGKILFTTPSTFKLMLDYAEEYKLNDLLVKTNKVCLGGEAVTNAIVKKYFALTHGKGELYNLYGPTEGTVCTTSYKIKNKEYSNVPIGKPVANTNIYILDKNQLCGIGMPGELCIGGQCLADGYLDRAELTNQKFVANPYVSGELMYRSGDLVRWLEDGNIEYLGRIDEQVKIRGFRIEISEIESKLCDIPGVKDAAVVVKQMNDDNILCGYVVSETIVDTAEIKRLLGSSLPDYMIPSFISTMNKLPMTATGKVNKRALPEPVIERKRQQILPGTPIEKDLAFIFMELLGIDSVGIEDNFFELGGHSLKATRLANSISKLYGVKIPLSVIINKQNIQLIAKSIEDLTGESKIEAIEIIEEEDF